MVEHWQYNDTCHCLHMLSLHHDQQWAGNISLLTLMGYWQHSQNTLRTLSEQLIQTLQCQHHSSQWQSPSQHCLTCLAGTLCPGSEYVRWSLVIIKLSNQSTLHHQLLHQQTLSLSASDYCFHLLKRSRGEGLLAESGADSLIQNIEIWSDIKVKRASAAVGERSPRLNKLIWFLFGKLRWLFWFDQIQGGWWLEEDPFLGSQNN